MNTKTMIKELNAVAEKHKNDFVPTFQTNISAMCRDIIPKLEQLAEYEAIGTVEEFREAMERQRAIKPIFEMKFGDCESKFSCECGKKIVVRHDRGVMDNHDGPNYCSNCGCKFDWSNNE